MDHLEVRVERDITIKQLEFEVRITLSRQQQSIKLEVKLVREMILSKSGGYDHRHIFDPNGFSHSKAGLSTHNRLYKSLLGDKSNIQLTYTLLLDRKMPVTTLSQATTREGLLGEHQASNGNSPLEA